MTPETLRPKKVSHGEAIHRRRVKAEARRSNILQINKFIEINSTKIRLSEIDELLNPKDGSLPLGHDFAGEQKRAELEVEHIWLERKCGLISPEQQVKLLSDKFDRLQLELPDVYEWLTGRVKLEPTRAELIRQKVMPPPPQIAGYGAKK